MQGLEWGSSVRPGAPEPYICSWLGQAALAERGPVVRQAPCRALCVCVCVCVSVCLSVCLPDCG